MVLQSNIAQKVMLGNDLSIRNAPEMTENSNGDRHLRNKAGAHCKRLKDISDHPKYPNGNKQPRMKQMVRNW